MQLPGSALSFKRIAPKRLWGRGAADTTMTITVLLFITEVRRALASLYSSLLSDDMNYILGT